MTAEPAVVGRRAELAAIESFVASVERAPAVLLLEGDVGVGKTTLFRAGVAAARAQGAQVLVARPIQTEAQLAYAALGDLLEAVPDEVLAALPPPQRKAIEVALLRAEPDDEQELLPRAVALGLLGALRLLAQRAPTVVAIDDVQWLDAPSERALSFVARRLEHERIGVLAARRTDGSTAGDLFGVAVESASGLRVQRREIGALGPTDVDRLLREHLGRALPRRIVTRLHEMSGGNAYFALEIARCGLGDVDSASFTDAFPVPPNLQQLVGVRLTALSAHAREATNVVAVLWRATVPVVEAAMEGSDRAAGIAEAVAAGVLDRSGDRLAFSHPLLQSIAYAQIPAEERRRLHARVAVLLFDPEERGRHFGLAAEEPGDLVALSLDWAARRARARGAPDAAADLLEQARQLTPAGSPEDARRRGIAAAERHFEAGNILRADALLDELVTASSPGRERALALVRLGWVRAHSQGLHAAEAAFRAALAEHAAEDELRVDIEQGLAWSVHSTASAAEALVHARVALDIAQRLDDAALAAGALSYVAILESLSGAGVRVDDAARAAELGHTPVWSQILGRTDWVHALLLQWQGHLEDARSRFVSLLERADAHGDEHALPAILFQLARIEVLLGDWVSADRHARECIDAGERSGQVGEQPYSLTVAALVDAHLGRVERARAELAAARRLAVELGVQPADFEAQVIEAFLELSLGDSAAAAAIHDGLIEASERAGFRDPALLRHRADAVEAYLALGRREDAARVAADLDALAAAVDRPFVRMLAARSRGLIAAAGGDVEAAQRELRAATAIDVEGEPFEQARTTLALGVVLRRDKQKRAARDEIGAARAEFARLGATLWVDRAEAELARVGGGAVADDALTPTERRIAELIAAGRSYRETADELFISPKTVQWNLSKVYKKLGIRTRAELPARLADRPGPHAG